MTDITLQPEFIQMYIYPILENQGIIYLRGEKNGLVDDCPSTLVTSPFPTTLHLFLTHPQTYFKNNCGQAPRIL